MRTALFTLFVAAAACVLGAVVPARALAAGGFAYIDAQGVLSVADDLKSVPEPFLGIYRRQAADQSRARAAAQRDLPNSGGWPEADGQRAERAKWDAVLQRWRTQLITSTNALQQAESARLTVGNPLLKATPTGHEAWVRLTERIDAARTSALFARRMLVDTLPAQARAQHVPPQWLLP